MDSDGAIGETREANARLMCAQTFRASTFLGNVYICSPMCLMPTIINASRVLIKVLPPFVLEQNSARLRLICSTTKCMLLNKMDVRTQQSWFMNVLNLGDSHRAGHRN